MSAGRYRLLIRRTGGPEVIEAESLAELSPAVGELLVRTEAAGLNFIDTYHRSGLYPVPLPSGLGSESVGIVEAVGSGVEGVGAGDRVAIFAAGIGAYATHRLVKVDRVVPLPDDIASDVAAAAMLKGCTAEFLVERCARIRPGMPVLVHAAAGGVGSILVPWLKAVGARVIAHAGSEAKADAARALGADHALSCPFAALPAKVRELTGGTGVAAVLDGVGAASWQASLASVARRGMLVTFGNASGPVPPVDIRAIHAAGSIFVTRPTLFDYVATAEELRHSADRVFQMIRSGAVPITIGSRFRLDEAADAHRALEARKTVGSTILIP